MALSFKISLWNMQNHWRCYGRIAQFYLEGNLVRNEAILTDQVSFCHEYCTLLLKIIGTVFIIFTES